MCVGIRVETVVYHSERKFFPTKLTLVLLMFIQRLAKKPVELDIHTKKHVRCVSRIIPRETFTGGAKKPMSSDRFSGSSLSSTK